MSSTSDANALNICVITVSDTRTSDNDTSGQYLAQALVAAGHLLHTHMIVKDDIYKIRALVSQLIVDDNVHAVLMTGGTGFSGRDSTPEAVSPLFDKDIPGFGELFRAISYKEIGSSTIQSRTLAGYANQTVIFCLPGSTNACKTGWENIISEQLNSAYRPCNFVGQLTSNKASAPQKPE